MSKKDQDAQLALLATGGNVKAAAAQLGISRQALHARISGKPHLRPSSSFDRPMVDKLYASVQMLDVALDKEEWWAVRQVLDRSVSWNNKTPVPRPSFSDKQVEDLLLFDGGDLEFYRAIREKLAKERTKNSGKLSLRDRRLVIETAVSATLKIPCKDVWRRLKNTWVVFENR